MGTASCARQVAWLDLSAAELVRFPLDPVSLLNHGAVATAASPSGTDLYVAGLSAADESSIVVLSSADSGATWHQ